VSPRTYEVLANIVFVIHILVVVYMLSGVVLGAMGFMSKHPTYQQVNLLVIGGIIFSQILFGGCPLVLLETSLRHQYDPSIHPTGSFTVALIKSATGASVPVMMVTICTYLIGITLLAGCVYTKISK
jgi:hypothetical protein